MDYLWFNSKHQNTLLQHKSSAVCAEPFLYNLPLATGDTEVVQHLLSHKRQCHIRTHFCKQIRICPDHEFWSIEIEKMSSTIRLIVVLSNIPRISLWRLFLFFFVFSAKKKTGNEQYSDLQMISPYP